MSTSAKNLDIARASDERASLNDERLVRQLIADTIKRCSKKREQIAEEMSFLLDRNFTVAMLNAFTAESAGGHRFPLSWVRAFCRVTGDDSLVRELAQRAGLTLISGVDLKLLELGRKVMAAHSTDLEIRALKLELGGQA